jgi:hypothetical protein
VSAPPPDGRRRAGAGRRARALVAACVAVAACGAPGAAPPPRPLTVAEVAENDWPREIALAQAAAARLEFAMADSVLRAFGARFPGTPQAAEATFWRALFRVDAAAAGRDPARDALRDATAVLDAYLAGGAVQPRYTEASVLRRVATQLDSLRVLAESTRVVPPAPVLRDSLKVRDDELARLRQQLQEVTAELERMRRRLAPRRP